MMGGVRSLFILGLEWTWHGIHTLAFFARSWMTALDEMR